jgi:hypothetical protein
MGPMRRAAGWCKFGLLGEYTQFPAPTPRNSKVRILAQPTGTLAIMRLSGRPRGAAITSGEAVILAALADSGWTVTGRPILRLHSPPGLLPWTGWFEVALPVTAAQP